METVSSPYVTSPEASGTRQVCTVARPPASAFFPAALAFPIPEEASFVSAASSPASFPEGEPDD